MNKLLAFVGIITLLTACSQKEEKITRLWQLEGRRLMVLTGTAADIAARNNFPKAEILDVYSTTDAAYNVKLGKADAFIFDEVVLQNIVRKYPASLTIVEEPVTKAEIAVAFNKERTVLMEKVNSALEKLRNNGTLKAMKQKWIHSGYQTVPGLPRLSDEENRDTVWVKNGFYYQLSNTPNGETESTLKVGICAQFEPMMFVYKNQYTGFDMELALRLGKMLGKKIEVVDMSFDSLILSLQSGKVDFAISNFEITPQRKEFVNFSEPYLVQDISALVRK